MTVVTAKAERAAQGKKCLDCSETDNVWEVEFDASHGTLCAKHAASKYRDKLSCGETNGEQAPQPPAAVPQGNGDGERAKGKTVPQPQTK